MIDLNEYALVPHGYFPELMMILGLAFVALVWLGLFIAPVVAHQRTQAWIDAARRDEAPAPRSEAA